MNKKILGCVAALSLLGACQEASPSAPTIQQVEARKSEEAANSLQFGKNAERENILRRNKLTANPGQIGFVLLLNQAGQPIMYTSVKGKITSGGKRLTKPKIYEHMDCGEYMCDQLTDGPSDEGTYGQSGEYVYFWTVDGQYVQWNGGYLYSDMPFRTNVKPLVIKSADPTDDE